MGTVKFNLLAALPAILGSVALAAPAQTATAPASTSIDLAAPFGAHAGWRFTAVQGPDIPDPLGEAGDRAPGSIRLCVSPDGGRSCRPNLSSLLVDGHTDDLFSQPHFLEMAQIVRPRADLPLLLIQAASLHSGDGDQRVVTIALAYDRKRDGFSAVYEKLTGHNNNQEIRYIDHGALRGAIISAEPTADAPFGFWMTVSKPGADGRYVQALRYRSATVYADGNPLAVIDSEMPNIQQRLGLWRPGTPPPLPAGTCPKPHLVARELWCVTVPAR